LEELANFSGSVAQTTVKGTSWIEHNDVTPFQGFAHGGNPEPRALPWAGMSRPCGVDAGNLHG